MKIQQYRVASVAAADRDPLLDAVDIGEVPFLYGSRQGLFIRSMLCLDSAGEGEHEERRHPHSKRTRKPARDKSSHFWQNCE